MNFSLPKAKTKWRIAIHFPVHMLAPFEFGIVKVEEEKKNQSNFLM